jgi:hypothetical protein
MWVVARRLATRLRVMVTRDERGKMKRKILLVLIALAMAIGLSAVVAGPAQAVTTHHTAAQLRAYEVGKFYGPNSYTSWGKGTITGFTTPCGGTLSAATVAYKQYPSPLVAPRVTPAAVLGPNICLIQPNDWWNPFSWDWSSILGSFWDQVWNKCISGALKGVVTTASGVKITELLIKGAKVGISPEGYVVLAISSCLISLSW